MASEGFSYAPDTLRNMAQDVIDYARSKGASACQVDVSEGCGQSVTVRSGEVETIEYNRDKGVNVTAYLGQRKGYASTSDFSMEALRSTVEAALSIARFTAEDDCAGLAEEALLAREFPDLDLLHSWDLPVEEAIEIARRCEAAGFAVSPLIQNSDGATVSSQQGQYVLANSAGFMGHSASSQYYISCSMIAGSGDNMQRDDWYAVRRDPNELASPEAIGDYAARRTLARLGARKVPTCEVPVLFEAPLASGLIGSLVHATSGGSLYRKSSFLLDSLGKQVFSPIVQISERAFIPKALGSSVFDNDGVATRDRELVIDGVLQGYFLSVYSGRKLGMKSTGNAGGCHNLLVKSGKHDFAGLLKKMGRGLLVTDLLGQGVNYVTGDYSRGAAGFWVEDGVIQYPVQEITIASNLRDMFKGIVEVGADTLARGTKQVGSILIENMTVAGA